MRDPRQALTDHARHRETLEAWFRSHPLQEIEAEDLKKVTPHYQQRISEIRKMSGLRIENIKRTRIVNGEERAADGGYRFVPHEPLGRSADQPSHGWPVFDAPIQDTFRLTPPENR